MRAEIRQRYSEDRIVFGKRSGVIRGQVNVTGGALLKGWRMSVTARSEKKGPNVFGGVRGSVEVDNKGQFVIEGLTPGEYELRLMTYPVFNPNSPPPPNQNVPAPVTQKVIVPKGQEAQVTMTLDLSGENRKER